MRNWTAMEREREGISITLKANLNMHDDINAIASQMVIAM
jgi:hypothetical protein